MVDLDAELWRVFDQIFSQEHVCQNDKIGIRIEFEGDSQPFFKTVRFFKNPLRQLFDAIARVLQSNRELLLSRWHVTVIIIPAPRGGGNKRTKHRYVPWSFECAAKKRSTITIANEDSSCLWRAVVVAHAYAVCQKIISLGHVPKAEALRRFRQVARRGSKLETKVFSPTHTC